MKLFYMSLAFQSPHEPSADAVCETESQGSETDADIAGRQGQPHTAVG